MNIKSLLLGSAAALAVVSGAQAADAIVAAEPEPVEYVRVCDAYGTGYFYIPGTETCLQIGGYVRFDVGFGAGDAFNNNGSEDWDARTRAHINVIAKSDTEYGVLTSAIILESNFRPNEVDSDARSAGASSTFGSSQDSTGIDEAYIDLAGFRVGKFANWWDDDFSGETDVMTTLDGSTKQNSIRYQYDAGDFYAGIALEELVQTEGGNANNLGIDGSIGGKVGGFTYAIIGAYDTDAQEGAVLAKVGVDVGPGTLSVAGIYSTGLGDQGFNGYYDAGEWSVAAQYALKATDKFTVTPAVQYIDNIDADASGSWDSGSELRAGVTLDYKVVENLSTKLTATYVSDDHDNAADQDWVEGFFRLQRDF